MDLKLQTQVAEAYTKGFGGPTFTYGTSEQQQLRGLVELAVESFKVLDPIPLQEVYDELEGRGTFIEAAVWEDPSASVAPHKVIEAELKKKSRAVVLELLQVQHDLENYLRPNMLRAAWCADVLAGGKGGYAASQIVPPGQRYAGTAHTFTWATKQLGGAPANLKKAGKGTAALTGGIQAFVAAINAHTPPLDKVRDWVAHRNFIVGKSGVGLGILPVTATPPSPAAILAVADVTELRRAVLRHMTILFGFKVAFLIQVQARKGDLHGYSWMTF